LRASQQLQTPLRESRDNVVITSRNQIHLWIATLQVRFFLSFFLVTVSTNQKMTRSLNTGKDEQNQEKRKKEKNL